MKQKKDAPAGVVLERGLPSNIDAEKLILGSVLLDDNRFPDVSRLLTTEHFALEKHRRIYIRMIEMNARGERIDRVTLANELMRQGELESVDGLSYLVSLDDGLPVISNLSSYCNIIIEKFRLRRVMWIGQRLVTAAATQTQTADEISQGAQAELLTQVGGFGSSQIATVSDFIDNYPGGINVMLDPSRRGRGIPTGFLQLDDWTDGFHPEEIFVFGARPGSGKTAIALNIAKTIARTGRRVAFFSLEMSRQLLMDRMFCEEAFISLSKFRRGELREDDRTRLRTAALRIKDLPLWIDDTSGLRVADIRVKLQSITRDMPVDLMIIDYAQLIRGPKGQRFNSENDKFTAIGEELKTLTKSTKIPLLLLSQLNRESEKAGGDGRPKLSQARGAGVWEEIAFVGACIYREWIKKRERTDLQDKAELIVDKNRSGRSGIIQLRFVDWLMRFENPDAVSET